MRKKRLVSATLLALVIRALGFVLLSMVAPAVSALLTGFAIRPVGVLTGALFCAVLLLSGRNIKPARFSVLQFAAFGAIAVSYLVLASQLGFAAVAPVWWTRLTTGLASLSTIFWAIAVFQLDLIRRHFRSIVGSAAAALGYALFVPWATAWSGAVTVGVLKALQPIVGGDLSQLPGSPAVLGGIAVPASWLSEGLAIVALLLILFSAYGWTQYDKRRLAVVWLCSLACLVVIEAIVVLLAFAGLPLLHPIAGWMIAAGYAVAIALTAERWLRR